jgi:hypothetical protein
MEARKTLRSMPSSLLNSVTMPSQHMENFRRPLEMMKCHEQKPFAGRKCFLKAETFLKMSSAADDHQQHGQVTTQNLFILWVSNELQQLAVSILFHCKITLHVLGAVCTHHQEYIKLQMQPLVQVM